MSGIKRTLMQNHTFQYLSRHAGKGSREMIKRVHRMNEKNQTIKTHNDRESTEKEISNQNIKYLTKAHQTEVHVDKMCYKLKEDEVRDKTLKRGIAREDCNSNDVYEFLKLLKRSHEVSTRQKKITSVND